MLLNTNNLKNLNGWLYKLKRSWTIYREIMDRWIMF